MDKVDFTKMGAEIARVYSDDANGEAAETPILAIPFSAPSGDPAAQKLADSVFAQLYGKLAISHHGQVGLVSDPLAAPDAAAAADQGREHHSNYVVCGAVDDPPTPASLAVKILRVSDASVVWSESSPIAGADPARIAAGVDSKMQTLEDN